MLLNHRRKKTAGTNGNSSSGAVIFSSVFCSLLFLLQACGDGNGSRDLAGQDYLIRLAGVLDVDLNDAASAKMVSEPERLFPTGESLRIDRAENKLSVLDTLEIHRCNLGSLIGARNGSLGRVQTPSQRYLYDLKILAGLKACASRSESLERLHRLRREERPIALFNALFGGEEWHDFATAPVIARATPADSGQLERSLATLLSIAPMTEYSDAAEEGLEAALGMLRFSRALGEQRQRWRAQSEVLETASRLLGAARKTNPGCRTGQPTEAGRIRLNIFQTYYAEQLQPQLAQQAQPDRGWLRVLVQLVGEATKEVAQYPQAQRVFQWHAQVLGEEPGQEFGRWKSALDDHTRAWQWQLRTCGLLPGRPDVVRSMGGRG